MTINIDVNEAKSNLEQMLQQIRQGEEAIITDNGVAVARIIPYSSPKPRKTLAEIKQILQEQKPSIQEKYQVSELGIFGSYVRGEDPDDSDIDVLVEFSKTPGLLKFIGLENELSDLMEMKVDLVHKAGLKPAIGKRILAEVIYL
jgi:prevent-host-death family protein